MNFTRRCVCILCVAGTLPGARAAIGATTNPTTSALLKEATDAAGKIADADEKADTLGLVVMIQARTGDIAGAKLTAETIAVPRKKGFAYANIADALARSGDIDGATAVAESVTDANAKAGIYENIAEAQARKGDIAAAQATAANITEPFNKAHTNGRIALAQAAAGDLDAAKATIAALPSTDDLIVETWVNIAEMQATGGKKAESDESLKLAIAAMDQVPDYLQDIALGKFVAGETKTGNLSKAMQLANYVKAPPNKEMLLSHIASAQIEMGDLAGARSTAARLTKPSDQVDNDASLASAEAKTGDVNGARRLVTQASALAPRIQPPPIRAMYCEGIATAQVQANGEAAAVAWARSQKDPEVRARALLGVVEGLPDYHKPSFP